MDLPGDVERCQRRRPSLKTHPQLKPPCWLRINWDNPSEPDVLNGPEVTLSDTVCFCCLRGVDQLGSLTEEDVFPRWLTRRYPALQNETYNYFSRVPVKLGAIKIPACQSCNNEYLSNCLEKPISEACGTLDAARQLPPNIWGSWAAKIFYGIYLKGVSLRADLRDPMSHSLINEEFVLSINSVRTLTMLAAAVFELVPHGALHSTVALVPCREEAPPSPVDFIDAPQLQAIAMRVGAVGLIVCLGDGGLTDRVLTTSSFYKDYTRKPLTAFRFREAAAMVFYQRSRLTWTPEPVFLQASHCRVACVINTMTLSGGPLQTPFEAANARAMFASVFHIPYENVRWTKKQGIVVDLPVTHPLAAGALDE
jgi:hypothetical protein